MKILLLFLLVLSTITGCSFRYEQFDDKDQDKKTTRFGSSGTIWRFTTEDGVDCIYAKMSTGGGLSCNWEKEIK